MNIEEFDYDLPQELIAQAPSSNRVDSRLLVCDPTLEIDRQLMHVAFRQLENFLQPGDLVVVNNTRVLPARLQAEKPTGGVVEIMLERLMDDETVLVQLKSNKRLQVGQILRIKDFSCEVIGRQERFFIVKFAHDVDVKALFANNGTVPLPPYIKRVADQNDGERYQTVYAKAPGAVAAPTAGLHFDNELIQRIKDKGVDWASVTLHVGAGTFLPVQVSSLEEHIMHKEWIEVSRACCESIESAKKRGGRVIAVGTTVVRSLETAARSGQILPYAGDTQLFIKPGFKFNIVDKLITNFHLPKSTLLVLVSAFAGYDRIMSMYQYAIEEKLRFFSYGDAMLLERRV